MPDLSTRLIEEAVRDIKDRGWVSQYVVDDGNNRLLWNDKAPTPNQVIDLVHEEIKKAVEKTLDEVATMLFNNYKDLPRGEAKTALYKFHQLLASIETTTPKEISHE